MPIPSFDPRPQNEPLLAEIKDAIASVLASGRFIGGEEVESFERDFAAAIDVPHAVAVSSGTDALLVALMALGVGAGDLVVTTPFTFFATAGAIHRLGARPVFCDIDPRSLLLAPERVAELLTLGRPRRPAGTLKVLLPVHLFGRAAEFAPLAELAVSHGLEIVEDVAQAFGARNAGRAAGGFGRLGCFSFHPTKNLGGLGDGGMVTTWDAALAARVRMLRNHGQGAEYEHTMVGGNFRLDALQCAVLRIKLRRVAAWNRERAEIAHGYCNGFEAAGLLDQVRLPTRGADGQHVFQQFVIRVPRRDELRAFLAAQGIGSAVYYARPLHLQPCFRELGYRPGDLPEAEQAAREVLALPIYPGLPRGAIDAVVTSIASFLRA